MNQKIPQPFIQEVISRTDLFELIGARIELKKRGDNASACCPFHNEKTPSFSVSQSKQFYYCFGCGAHGNAINFLMNYDRLPFMEAVTSLADAAGLTVPSEAFQGPTEDYSLLYKVLDQAKVVFQKNLAKSNNAISYLKSRNLTGETARNFCIGYAPQSWDFLCNSIGNQKDHRKALHTTGMIIEKNPAKYYDRFRDRIMFPIRDTRGRTIAFGGRILQQGTPKYLNSPETPVFHKSKTLYGLYEAYQHQKKLDVVLVVEGYMDVIALAQNGIHYAVATLGTAVNIQHIQLLSRYTADIVFCFDGDNAGRKAAWKALTISLALLRDGFNLRFLFLPSGEDPDSLIQKTGKDNFEKLIQNAAPLTEVFFSELHKIHSIDTIAGKAAFGKEAISHLNNMPQGIFKNLLLDKLANTLQISRNELSDLATKKIEIEPAKPIQKETTDEQKFPRLSNRLTPIQQAIQILLHEPSLASEINNINFLKNEAGFPEHQLLYQLITQAKENPNTSMGALFTTFKEGAKNHLVEISSRQLLIPKNGRQNELQDALLRIQEQHQYAQLSALIEKSKHSELNHEEKQLLQLLLAKKHVRNI